MVRRFPSSGIVDKVRDYFRKFVFRRPRYPSPQDSWALFAHFPLTFFLFWGTFFVIYHGYFSDEVISCKSLGGGLQELTDPVKVEICLHYSHIDIDENEGKGSILAYPWHPYILMAVCVAMFLPRLVKKLVSHQGLERFLDSLSREDVTAVDQKAVQYCYEYIGSHGGQLAASLKVSLTCLLADLLAVFLLDTASQNTFYNSVIHFPYIRDMATYKYAFSRVFPPTARCSITPTMQIALRNTENFGCTLPLNWFYEKIYILLFVYFVVLLTVSVVSVFVDIWMLLPFKRIGWVSMGGHYVNWSQEVAQHWSLDELFVLRYFRDVVKHDTFVDVMARLLAIQETTRECVGDGVGEAVTPEV